MHQKFLLVFVLCCLGSNVALYQQQGGNGMCGKIGKFLMCKCMAEGCEDGLLPSGFCPMLPMMPMLPKMQCCPMQYLMYCMQVQNRNPRQARTGNSLTSLGSTSLGSTSLGSKQPLRI